MKNTGFRKQSLEEIKEKQAIKREKMLSKPRKVTLQRTPLSKRANGANLPKKGHTKKKPTQAKLKKLLDSVFSQYIRMKYPERCYTCGVQKPRKELQNGHFVSRQYLATRFDENNCRPQCVGCNMFGNGKPLDFEENLKKELGSDFVEAMKAKRHLTVKLDRAWYTEQIEKYTSILNGV